MSKSTTSFGFQDVPFGEKKPLVKEVFESVAKNYDVMNDAMSFGVHRWWKKELIEFLHPRPTQHLLDIAGGTGDIASAFLKAGGGKATIVDINKAMLAAGKKKFPSLNFTYGDGEELPFPDCAFDCAANAFGLRNMTDIPKALAEAHRVIKPGSLFCTLEFSKVSIPLLDKIYDAYSFNAIPFLGEKIAGDRAAYQYLVESIRRFPPQEELQDLFKAAGFQRTGYFNLTGGVVAIHYGWRI
ncbi:MAG: class I SAM-dependent methyltransferase [Dongiaceae bacterium]